MSRKNSNVYTYEKPKRKKPSAGRTLLSILITFLVAGAIGVLGYSIAKPFLTFTGIDELLETELPIETTTTVPFTTTTLSETTTATSSTTETTAMTTEPVPDEIVSGKGVLLSEMALNDEVALSSAISDMVDAEFVVIPLKIEGGTLLYQTENTTAVSIGAATGTMTLSEIVSIVEETGKSPIALVNLCEDNLLPNADASAGYTIAEEGSRWLDNRADAGGKPWLNPFSDMATLYLSDLVAEISESGFVQIWCEGLVFPAFRETDLNYIGETVQDSARGQVFVSLMDAMTEAANGTKVIPVFDAATLRDGTNEAYETGAFSEFILEASAEFSASAFENLRFTESGNLLGIIAADATFEMIATEEFEGLFCIKS